MYECKFNTMKSLKVIKIATFDQNEFMTCYLIFNFRPTFFSYFSKFQEHILLEAPYEEKLPLCTLSMLIGHS